MVDPWVDLREVLGVLERHRGELSPVGVRELLAVAGRCLAVVGHGLQGDGPDSAG
jgi:hypothetical protein